MPFIPSNKDEPIATQDTVTMAGENIAAALKPFFVDSDEKLAEATKAALDSINHMLTMREVRQSRLGATVMTESASARKRPGSTPRHI